MNQMKYLNPTLGVLLDIKHYFMTKMMKHNGNVLHPIRFEEILDVVDKLHPILA